MEHVPPAPDPLLVIVLKVYNSSISFLAGTIIDITIIMTEHFKFRIPLIIPLIRSAASISILSFPHDNKRCNLMSSRLMFFLTKICEFAKFFRCSTYSVVFLDYNLVKLGWKSVTDVDLCCQLSSSTLYILSTTKTVW